MFTRINRRKDLNTRIKFWKLLMLICIVVFGISACGTTNNDVEIQAEKIVEAVENNDIKMLETIMLGTEDLVRHANDGNKYLYDFTRIKKEASSPLES